MTNKERALQIKNETVAGANTALRVGGLFEDIALEDLIYIEEKADFPDAVDGAITLLAGKTYVVTTDIDLEGDRLVAGGVCNLFGLSSETSFLTSTGLGVGVPLLTSIYTVVLERISIKDIDTGVSFNGETNLVALDWKAVNFIDVPNVGLIDNIDNFIFDTGSFLGAQGLKFTGTIGTVALNNSLFRGLGSAGNIIELDASCVITRRFRINISSIIVFGDTVGVTVNADTTLPVESFILNNVNFAGGGTYLGGLTHTSDKALFTDCIGITNVSSIGNMFMKNNEVATVITTVGDRYPMLGVTQVNAINQRFEHDLDNNALRYIGNSSNAYHITVSFTLSPSANNQKYGIYIGVNRGGAIDADADRISESEVYINTPQSGRADAAAVQALVNLNKDDRVYLILQNVTSTANATIEFMNMIIL